MDANLKYSNLTMVLNADKVGPPDNKIALIYEITGEVDVVFVIIVWISSPATECTLRYVFRRSKTGSAKIVDAYTPEMQTTLLLLLE